MTSHPLPAPAPDTLLCAPAEPDIVVIPARYFDNGRIDPERVIAFSDATGLIEIGETEEAARMLYRRALSERMPLRFAAALEREAQLEAERKAAQEAEDADLIATTGQRAPRGLDFSVFHPLDHIAGSPYCSTFYGYLPRHISLWWDYQFDYRPSLIIARAKCRLGRHAPGDMWRRSPASGRMLNAGGSCGFCGVELPRVWNERDAGI